MKRLKFLIVVLGLFAVHGAVAVTLPSTSYSPSDMNGEYNNDAILYNNVDSRISGSFIALRAADETSCQTDDPGVPKSGSSCEDCCKTASGVEGCVDTCMAQEGADIDECQNSCNESTGYKTCVNGCEQGASLPLDAPLWFMLALAALGTVVTLSVVQRSEESRNLR